VLFSSLLDVVCDGGGGGGGERAREEEEKGAGGPRTVGDLLAARGYLEERRLWNTLGGWHEDERRKGDVRMLVWRGGAAEEERVRVGEGKGRPIEGALAKVEL